MAGPPDVLADPRRRHPRRAGVVWPLTLIIVGSVFLLQNMGLLAPNAWLGLWRLWPLLLVLIGLDLLLAHRRSLAVLVGLLVGLMALGMVAGAVDLPGLSASRQ